MEGSDGEVHSRLRYLEENKTYVKGQAWFKPDNTVEIWLVYGCYPKVAGRKRESHDLGYIQVKLKVMPQKDVDKAGSSERRPSI